MGFQRMSLERTEPGVGARGGRTGVPSLGIEHTHYIFNKLSETAAFRCGMVGPLLHTTQRASSCLDALLLTHLLYGCFKTPQEWRAAFLKPQ